MSPEFSHIERMQINAFAIALSGRLHDRFGTSEVDANTFAATALELLHGLREGNVEIEGTGVTEAMLRPRMLKKGVGGFERLLGAVAFSMAHSILPLEDALEFGGQVDRRIKVQMLAPRLPSVTQILRRQ